VTALRVFAFLVGTPMQLQSHYADALRVPHPVFWTRAEDVRVWLAP
jgi:hypothetical protein